MHDQAAVRVGFEPTRRDSVCDNARAMWSTLYHTPIS